MLVCVCVCVLTNLFSLNGTTLCTISCDIYAHVTFIVASGNGTWWKRRVGVCNLPCQQEVYVEFKPPHTTIPCSLHTVMSVWLCISMKMPTMICVVCLCVCVCVCMCVCSCACVCSCVCVYVRVRWSVYTCALECVYMHTSVYLCVHCTCEFFYSSKSTIVPYFCLSFPVEESISS